MIFEKNKKVFEKVLNDILGSNRKEHIKRAPLVRILTLAGSSTLVQPKTKSFNLATGSSTLVQPKTKSFNLATHWKMGFFYEIFCQI